MLWNRICPLIAITMMKVVHKIHSKSTHVSYITIMYFVLLHNYILILNNYYNYNIYKSIIILFWFVLNFDFNLPICFSWQWCPSWHCWFWHWLCWTKLENDGMLVQYKSLLYLIFLHYLLLVMHKYSLQ